MSSESPAVILYSSDGYELAAVSGSATPANTRGLLVEGSDGTNSRFITVDTSGRVVTVGAAATGAAASGNPLYIASLATTAAPTYTNNTVNPLSLDGYGNLRVLGAGQVTTAAPTYVTGTDNSLSLDTAGNLRVTGAGGTFPITGTVTATSTSNGNTGAAPPTQATYMGVLATTAANGGLTTGDMYPLNITTGGLLRIDGVYPTGAAPGADANLIAGSVTTAAPAYTTGQMSALSLDTVGNLRVLGSGFVTTAAPAYTNSTPNYLSLTTVGNLRVDGSSVTQPVTGTGTAGTPATGVVTIQGIAGGTAIPVSGTFTTDKSSTATLTQVAASTASVSLLASNANRVSATIFNTASSGLMYIAFAATASTTAFTVRVPPGTYYDLPVTYTGAISAIWTIANGSAVVTELSP